MIAPWSPNSKNASKTQKDEYIANVKSDHSPVQRVEDDEGHFKIIPGSYIDQTTNFPKGRQEKYLFYFVCCHSVDQYEIL